MTARAKTTARVMPRKTELCVNVPITMLRRINRLLANGQPGNIMEARTLLGEMERRPRHVENAP